MVWIRSETKYVTGIPTELGGSGDPSPVTAYGCYIGIKACAAVKYGNDSLQGKRIAIQGAGHVASTLAKHLTDDGAKVFITDIFMEKAQQVAAEAACEVIKPDDFFNIDCDILAPAAMGGIINDETIPKLKCDIIAGPANNQFAAASGGVRSRWSSRHRSHPGAPRDRSRWPAGLSTRHLAKQ